MIHTIIIILRIHYEFFMSYRLQVLVYHCIFINASRNFIQLYNIFRLRIIYVNKNNHDASMYSTMIVFYVVSY